MSIRAWKILGDEHEKIYVDSELYPVHPHSYKSILYIKPLAISLLILITGSLLYIYPTQNPINTAIQLWCLFQSGAVIWNLKEQIQFYSWWSNSNLSDSHKRGLGTNGYPLFGLIPMPKLSLSTFTIVALSYPLLLCLCAIFMQHSYVGYLFICTTTIALLYFSSLWAERNASYHREYITISVLLYLSFNPEFYGLTQNSNTIISIIKIHVVSIYVAGALQKTACSIWAKKPWFSCAPHSYLWRAMWSKPYYKNIQKFFFLRPKLMAVGAFCVLLLELLFFVQFAAPHEIQITMAICLMAFHVAVFVLQGIDYITFWNPVFLFWFVNTGGIDGNFIQSISHISMFPAATLCIAQLLYAFTFIEDININILNQPLIQ